MHTVWYTNLGCSEVQPPSVLPGIFYPAKYQTENLITNLPNPTQSFTLVRSLSSSYELCMLISAFLAEMSVCFLIGNLYVDERHLASVSTLQKNKMLRGGQRYDFTQLCNDHCQPNSLYIISFMMSLLRCLFSKVKSARLLVSSCIEIIPCLSFVGFFPQEFWGFFFSMCFILYTLPMLFWDLLSIYLYIFHGQKKEHILISIITANPLYFAFSFALLLWFLLCIFFLICAIVFLFSPGTLASTGGYWSVRGACFAILRHRTHSRRGKELFSFRQKRQSTKYNCLTSVFLKNTPSHTSSYLNWS